MAWQEVVAGANWRNVPVCVLATLFNVAGAVAHIEILTSGIADIGPRFGFAVTAVLIALIGGRIAPSFTRNVPAKRGKGRLPVPFGWFDRARLVVTVIALASAVWAGAFLLFVLAYVRMLLRCQVDGDGERR